MTSPRSLALRFASEVTIDHITPVESRITVHLRTIQPTKREAGAVRLFAVSPGDAQMHELTWTAVPVPVVAPRSRGPVHMLPLPRPPRQRRRPPRAPAAGPTRGQDHWRAQTAAILHRQCQTLLAFKALNAQRHAVKLARLAALESQKSIENATS